MNFRNITPLLMSVINDNVEPAAYLVEKGASFDIGKTFMHYARSQEMVDFLLGYGIDINTKITNGFTPLQQACNIKNLERVKLFLANGADLNMEDEMRVPPLFYAYLPERYVLFKFFRNYVRESDNVELSEYLINQGAKVTTITNSGETFLYKIEDKDHIFLEKLLKLIKNDC